MNIDSNSRGGNILQCSLYFYCKLREAKTTVMNSGILGKTAKDKKITASIQGLKMGRVMKDLGNFVQELETSVVYGVSIIPF